MKFEEAYDDLAKRIADPDEPGRPKAPPPPPDMSLFNAMMANSDFKGAGR